MKKNRKKKPSGLTRGKAILIAVLGGMLLVVWGGALFGDGDQVANGPRPKKPGSRVRAGAPRAPNQAKASQPSKNSLVDWPVIPVSEATKNDPFAKPAWAITQAPRKTLAGTRAGAARKKAERDLLLQQGASMIIISGNEKIALIGEKEVRVGDQLAGYEVLEITRQGVVLADQEEN